MRTTPSRFAVGAVVSSLVLGAALLSAGCPSSQQATRPPDAPTAPNPTPSLGKDVPPQVAGSIKDAQAAGNAYRDNAMKNGAAGGAASNGWR
jgi:hypothetical protein